MFQKRSAPAAALLFAVVVFSAAGTADAQKDREQHRKRLQRAVCEQRIRQNQMRLRALEQEEAAIRRQVQYIEKQIPAAREKLKQAQQQLRSTETAIGYAQQTLKQAKAATKNASENLAAVAKRVEESQPAGSPFARAMKSYLAARAQYTEAVDAVVNSRPYKDAYARAAASASRSKLLVKLRREWIQDDPAVKTARYQLDTSKAAYDKLRSEVLRKSSDWLEASDALIRAKNLESEAERQVKTTAGKFAAMKRFFARMQHETRVMEMALPRGKEALKRIPQMKRSIRRQIEEDRRALHRNR